MTKIFKNMAPYWYMIVAIVLLLIVQAFGDLSLPQYTSDIIDVGIQNKGVEHILPVKMTEDEYEISQLYMTSKEKKIWKDTYEKKGEYYICKAEDEEKLDQLDDTFLTAIFLNHNMSNVKESQFKKMIKNSIASNPAMAPMKDKIDDMSVDEIGKMLNMEFKSFQEEDDNGKKVIYVDVRPMLYQMKQTGMMSAKDIQKSREEIEKKMNDIGESTLFSTGVAYATKCDKAAGVDIDKIQTDYLWKEILRKDDFSNIIENYVQIICDEDEETHKKSYKQIFPRYHQLQLVTSLLADAKRDGVGKRYLIQHSAGSGKSNSIAWLAHQLVTLKDATDHNIFDTVIVVTDRVNLDKQIRNTIRQFMQVSSTVGWAKDSSELGTLLEKGTKIIITIVHKFQFILEDISKLHTNRNFAILIDEAHSSQNGDLSTKMNIVLSGSEYDNDDLLEDKINTLIDGKKLAKNASYFAFTATPKNKTLEVFGREEIQPDGSKRFFPHYVYTMKQAIEEHFIMDVLRYYTPIQSFYKLSKTVEDDPLFDKKKAQRLLRYYVESNQYAIEQKAGIIVEHFHTEVIGRGKIGGRARAMVITSGIPRAIEYYKAINALLEQRKSPYKTIIAFSGTTKYEGREVTEADLNGFTSSKIERTFKKDPYRILIVANKFQTGFDEPLLHTMYVDKGLSDIKAVQTLSRLNRSAPDKNDTFILDFVNDPGVIKAAFDKYYKTTILSGETDVNKLNDQISEMESLQVYTHEDVDSFVEAYLDNAPREELDPILDRCTENYKELIPEEQILFKSNAKGFVRTYNFLSAILPYGSVEWEKLSIFLKLLIGKLPSPAEDDNISGLLEDIDLESYRAVAQDTMRIQLDNENGELNPIPVSRDVGISVPELDPLTQILKEFHDAFGGIDWTDEDKVKKQVADLPAIVSKDEAYQNAIKNSDAQNARVESDRATMQAILDSMSTTIELYKAVNENPALCKWIQDMVFANTYQTSPPAKEDQPDFD